MRNNGGSVSMSTGDVILWDLEVPGVSASAPYVGMKVHGATSAATELWLLHANFFAVVQTGMWTAAHSGQWDWQFVSQGGCDYHIQNLWQFNGVPQYLGVDVDDAKLSATPYVWTLQAQEPLEETAEIRACSTSGRAGDLPYPPFFSTGLNWKHPDGRTWKRAGASVDVRLDAAAGRYDLSWNVDPAIATGKRTESHPFVNLKSGTEGWYWLQHFAWVMQLNRPLGDTSAGLNANNHAFKVFHMGGCTFQIYNDYDTTQTWSVGMVADDIVRLVNTGPTTWTLEAADPVSTQCTRAPNAGGSLTAAPYYTSLLQLQDSRGRTMKRQFNQLVVNDLATPILFNVESPALGAQYVGSNYVALADSNDGFYLEHAGYVSNMIDTATRQNRVDTGVAYNAAWLFQE
eukprot:28187-Rhodomonas_salina.1